MLNVLEYDEEGKEQVRCPMNDKHIFENISDLLIHLKECGMKSNKKTVYYICKYNGYHWFKTQHDRVIHEYFQCEDRKCVKPFQEAIITRNNQVKIPLQEDSDNVINFYEVKQNYQQKSDFINFFNQINHQDQKFIKLDNKTDKKLRLKLNKLMHNQAIQID